MNVQIFMSEDNKALIYDNEQLDEFKNLVEELGLQCNNHIDEKKSPIPYLLLDEALIRAFKLLCPTVDKIDKYRFEIPIEILRNVKLSKVESYFDWIEVWSNSKDPDPFCVGRVYKTASDRDNNYYWGASSYLIGRWGAENKTIPELMELAVSIAKVQIEGYTTTVISKLKSWQECPELWAKQYIFNGNGEVSQAIQNSLPF